MQDMLVLSGGMRYPDKLNDYYLHNSAFPFFNNEVMHPDFHLYRENIMKLNTFTLIMWDND